jgi:hypothetical protein
MDNLRGIATPGEAVFCQKLITHAPDLLGVAQIAH